MAILESKVNRNEAFERRTEHWRRRVEEIREQEARFRLGGGAKAQEKQRALGKMTARERVAALCDAGAPFLELGVWVAEGFYQEHGGAPAAGVVVGIGRIHGREVVERYRRIEATAAMAAADDIRAIAALLRK